MSDEIDWTKVEAAIARYINNRIQMGDFKLCKAARTQDLVKYDAHYKLVCDRVLKNPFMQQLTLKKA